MNHQFIEQVQKVVTLLVGRRYEELELLTKRSRLSAIEISKAIRDYGRELVLPPDNAYELMSAVKVYTKDSEVWSVTMPLWTCEEGCSDLSLEITITNLGKKDYKIQLDDIHVL